jgi:hypothetical protein
VVVSWHDADVVALAAVPDVAEPADASKSANATAPVP